MGQWSANENAVFLFIANTQSIGGTEGKKHLQHKLVHTILISNSKPIVAPTDSQNQMK